MNIYNNVYEKSIDFEPSSAEIIYFGMGCFWGAEKLFWNCNGIHVTAVGYSAGNTKNPTYKDICYGNTFHETPNLDRMAKEGMRFTQAYAAAPVCSPYRAALLTGYYPARLGITDYLRPDSDEHLSHDLKTLPEALHKLGYKTGMIGKWHLSGYKYHGAKKESRPTKSKIIP